MHLSTLTLTSLLLTLATADLTFKPQRQPPPPSQLLRRQEQPSTFAPPTSVLTNITPATTTTAQAPSTTIIPSGTRTRSGVVEPKTSTGSLAASGAGGQTGAVQQPRSSGEVNAAATATPGVRVLGAAVVGFGAAAVAGVLV